jgi:hypothetical protein
VPAREVFIGVLRSKRPLREAAHRHNCVKNADTSSGDAA